MKNWQMNNTLHLVLAASLLLAALPASAANEPAGAASSRLAKAPVPSKEDAIIGKLEFKDATMIDVIRALADMSNLNIVATEEAAKKRVTVFLQDISVKDALDTISKNSGLWYRQDKSGKTFRIMTTAEYQRDMVVYREETTRIFNLLHPNPIIVATAIRDIFPNRVRMTLGVEDTTTLNGTGTGGAAGTTGVAGTTTTGNTALRQATTRQTTDRTTTGGRATTGGTAQLSERMINEQLTPDQLAKLEAAAQGKEGGLVSSDELSKISGSEQPIYLTLNREHNLIIVRTSDTMAIKDIERLIKEMDRPTPQVLLEMKILELGVGESYKQVFDISYQAGPIKKGPGVWLPGDPLAGAAVVPIAPAAGNATPADAGYTGTLARQHTLTAAAGELFYQFLNNHIRAQLDLLETNKRVKTLNSPILLASNNKSAKVFVGQEQVVTTGYTVVAGTVTNGVKTNDSVIPTTELRNIGNTLQILPKINADRSVTLNIVQDTSSISANSASTTLVVDGKATAVPIDTVVTANVQSTVVAKDGLTVAIGGLISSSSSRADTKVPFLGDIPLLGKLFTDKNDSDTKKEMILLITPHIITTASEAEEVTRDAIEPISAQEW